MMTRQQAEIVLDGMSLDECIKMWNETNHDCRSREIHEIDEDEWWDYLHKELGLMTEMSLRPMCANLYETQVYAKFKEE